MNNYYCVWKDFLYGIVAGADETGILLGLGFDVSHAVCDDTFSTFASYSCSVFRGKWREVRGKRYVVLA